MHIGEKIRELRRRHGLTQDELGERVEIHGRHISRYENARSRPSPATVARIARFFGLDADVLTDEDAPLPPSKLALAQDAELAARFEAVSKLPDKQREAVIVLLDALIQNHRLTQALGPVATAEG